MSGIPPMLPSRSMSLPRSEYIEPTAEAGSRMLLPACCDADDNWENCEPADAGPLPLPSSAPKLPDRDRAALLSLLPLADCAVDNCNCGRPFCRLTCSCGVELLPMGVARRNCGRAGRDGCCRCRAGNGEAPLTGLALGDGGMERPSRGARDELWRPPGMGGRRRGAGEDMAGRDGDGAGCNDAEA